MDDPQYTKSQEPYKSWVERSRAILAPLIALGKIRSVLDLGCNCGPWLGALNDLGVYDVTGVNDQEIWDNILFDRRGAHVHDLTKPLDFGRRYDLVICLEVAEHLHGGDEGANELVRTISNHTDTLLFSAATPGQSGDGHVNCQPHEYWHERFKREGFQVWDVMRPILRDRSDTENWYKENMFLYTRRGGSENCVRSTKTYPTYSNWTFFVRCFGSRKYDDVGVLTNRIPGLRALHPQARIIVEAPWSSLPHAQHLRHVATENNCDCLDMDLDLHYTSRGAECLKSMLQSFLADRRSEVLVKFDPDTMFHRTLSQPTTLGVFGCAETRTLGGDAICPANLQGGCIVYTREAAEMLQRCARLDEPAYWANYCATWAKGVPDWMSHGERYGTLDDAVSRHACLIANIPMCLHPEIISYYIAPDSPNWWEGFAVSHPHKT